MHKYILAIQNLLVFICISYKPCITKSNIINDIKKTLKKCFFLFALSFFASYKAMIAFAK
jgi:hypothetical protein